MEASGQLHAPAALHPRGIVPVHIGPRAGSDDVEKRKFLTLPGVEIWPLARPVRS
jgi:hypothetical protein